MNSYFFGFILIAIRHPPFRSILIIAVSVILLVVKLISNGIKCWKGKK